MSRYINTLSNGYVLPSKGKVNELLNRVKGSKVIENFNGRFHENLVAVMHRAHFDAALYVEDKHTCAQVHTAITCPVTWMIVPNAASIADV